MARPPADSPAPPEPDPYADADLDPEAEAARFISGLIARGEAAEVDEHGELPEGATHEIFTDERGRRRVRRRRFSIE